jgi:hypothetical protein
VKSKAEAQKVFQAEDARIRAESHAKDLAAQKRIAQSEASLKKSQLQCLSKAYPETVALLSKPDGATSQAVFEAYQREVIELTGEPIQQVEVSAFQAAVKAWQNFKRRKNSAFDAVSFELVAGWHLRGYSRMTPEDRAEAVKKLGLGSLTGEAIRKKCQRLRLPATRKAGRPATN